MRPRRRPVATHQRCHILRTMDPTMAVVANRSVPGPLTPMRTLVRILPRPGSNPGYPAATPMLVKDHSESDLRVDPTNASYLIGSSKWFVSPEGYNHLLGFYESFDRGKTWSVQGHIPGYEGWTDNTDPVGAFDGFGNYYELILAYQFFYNADGTHNFQINPNREPNPAHQYPSS